MKLDFLNLPSIVFIKLNLHSFLMTKVRIGGVSEMFQKNEGGDYAKNVILCRNIFKFGLSLKKSNSGCSEQFKHWDLSKWLMSNHKEYILLYQDSDNRTPIKTRIENTRQRTKGILEILISHGLIEQSGRTKQERGNGTVELYRFTSSGYLLALLFKFEESSNIEEQHKASSEIFNVINTFIRARNHDELMRFLSEFFTNCSTDCSFDIYVEYFMKTALLFIDRNSSNNLMGTFLGLNQPSLWLSINPQTLNQTLQKVDEDCKRSVLFHFKIFLEEAYNRDYLRNLSNDSVEIAHKIPGKKWAHLRYSNIADLTMICIPAYCGKCDDECPFIYPIYDCISSFIPRKEGWTILNPTMGACCNKCGNKSVIVSQLALFPL